MHTECGDGRYLVNATSILDEYRTWEEKGYKLIFINVQTGAGKTEFIKRYMIPLMVERRQRFVMFVNRITLLEQVKKNFDEFFDEQFSGQLRPYEIMTYQKIEVDTMHRQSVWADLGHFDYVICDEAHYFLVDSAFNPKTQFSFESLCDVMPYVPVIMMSATQERLIPIMKKAYDMSFEKIKQGKQFYKGNSQTRTYEMQWDFSRYNFQYAVDYKELVKYITFSKEKFLIFVPSITEGNKIKNMIEKMDFNTEVRMLTSEEKRENGTIEHKIWKQIIEKNCFDCRILIATAILDNGISIHDAELKNVVVLASTREEFLQMLGRRRVKGDEKINVIILFRKKSYYTTKRDREYLPLINAYKSFKYNPDIYNITAIWNGNIELFKKAKRFSVVDSKQKYNLILKLNEFSENEFKYHFTEYDQVAKVFDYTDDLLEIYSTILRVWLKVDDVVLKPISRPHYELCEGLCEKLNELVDKKFTKKEFQEHFNPLHGQMNKLFRLKNFKSNDNVTIKVLNDFFLATDLPYKAEKKNKRSGTLYWITKTDL